MRILTNHHRPAGIPGIVAPGEQGVAQDPNPVLQLLERCPEAAPTPLRDLPGLAAHLGVARVWAKDETHRMGLGSFKALGAAYVIARDAEAGSLGGVTYVTASAGNHGLSLAAGARVFGASAAVYLSETVSESFATRLRAEGAEVVRAGSDYEQSMAAAAAAADRHGWRLLSDSSWPGYTDVPRRVMEGYLVIGAEVAHQLRHEATPTHVFLQAGVGGMAAALAGFVRSAWGDGPQVVVVEPESARPLMESIRAGRPVRADGPASVMGRLDCKEPSHLALDGLARWADTLVTVDDAQATEAVDRLAAHGVHTTPSGAAGAAAAAAGDLGTDGDSQVLVIISESDGRTQ